MEWYDFQELLRSLFMIVVELKEQAMHHLREIEY